MNACIVGVWDGTHIWLQWDGVPAARYEVRLSWRVGLRVSRWTAPLPSPLRRGRNLGAAVIESGQQADHFV
jgi:hypothetical protein